LGVGLGADDPTPENFYCASRGGGVGGGGGGEEEEEVEVEEEVDVI
jgi:hypothetical protein